MVSVAKTLPQATKGGCEIRGAPGSSRCSCIGVRLDRTLAGCQRSSLYKTCDSIAANLRHN
jgi:hypothetical protein